MLLVEGWYGVIRLGPGHHYEALVRVRSLSPWFSMFCSFHDKARLHRSILRGLWCIHNLMSGKLRLAKWFIPLAPKAKAKMVREVSHLVMTRRQRTLCNFLEFKGEQAVYMRRMLNHISRFQELRCFRICWRNRCVFEPTDSLFKVVYRQYASLFFVWGIGEEDNELITLEIIHRYVEVLDRYFGNVSGMEFMHESSTV